MYGKYHDHIPARGFQNQKNLLLLVNKILGEGYRGQGLIPWAMLKLHITYTICHCVLNFKKQINLNFKK
jgi:hypothetical protein